MWLFPNFRNLHYVLFKPIMKFRLNIFKLFDLRINIEMSKNNFENSKQSFQNSVKIQNSEKLTYALQITHIYIFYIFCDNKLIQTGFPVSSYMPKN